MSDFVRYISPAKGLHGFLLRLVCYWKIFNTTRLEALCTCTCANLLKLLTELMVKEGVGLVLESHSTVPQQPALGVMFRIVPGHTHTYTQTNTQNCVLTTSCKEVVVFLLTYSRAFLVMRSMSESQLRGVIYWCSSIFFMTVDRSMGCVMMS